MVFHPLFSLTIFLIHGFVFLHVYYMGDFPGLGNYTQSYMCKFAWGSRANIYYRMLYTFSFTPYIFYLAFSIRHPVGSRRCHGVLFFLEVCSTILFVRAMGCAFFAYHLRESEYMYATPT